MNSHDIYVARNQRQIIATLSIWLPCFTSMEIWNVQEVTQPFSSTLFKDEKLGQYLLNETSLHLSQETPPPQSIITTGMGNSKLPLASESVNGQEPCGIKCSLLNGHWVSSFCVFIALLDAINVSEPQKCFYHLLILFVPCHRGNMCNSLLMNTQKFYLKQFLSFLTDSW